MQGKNKTVTKEKEHKHITKGFWGFTLPGIIVQFLFGWFPICAAFIIVFQKYYIIKPSAFVGLDNFRYLFSDPLFFLAFRNTFYYAGLSITLTFIIPILISILLMEMKKGMIRIMMILWFIPVASMAGIIIWKWFYNVQYGLFNGILTSLGLPALRWLNDSRLVMFCLVLPGLIMYGPGLVYIATLQSIPGELYEAAELEGATFLQKVRNISLPRMRPVIAMMLILAVITRLQVFNQPYVMTGGGPNFATYTVVMHVYKLAFEGMKFGRATALAVLLFFIITTLVVVQRKYFRENIDL